MATLREYFDSECKHLTAHVDWSLGGVATSPVAPTIRAKIAYDFEANARYWYLYVPDTPSIDGYLPELLATPELQECMLSRDGDGVFVETGLARYSERQSTSTLVFSRRVLLYVDAELNEAGRAELVQTARRSNIFLVVRDREYARLRSEIEKPLAFISHDSRDKDTLVRDLALELTKLMCPVWYDEYSLKVGDSLRASIERGLREARKCIVVLSPNFLSNTGWTLAEFDAVFTRELFERKNVILPVWHNVDAADVYAYSPRLADRVGLASTLGAPELARRLFGVIRSET